MHTPRSSLLVFICVYIKVGVNVVQALKPERAIVTQMAQYWHKETDIKTNRAEWRMRNKPA